jgi:hypothetical protein|tara:strand:- start:735 stop:941 length:207 start_codon:yes stop_codon:yes gene_type:complete
MENQNFDGQFPQPKRTSSYGRNQMQANSIYQNQNQMINSSLQQQKGGKIDDLIQHLSQTGYQNFNKNP